MGVLASCVAGFAAGSAAAVAALPDLLAASDPPERADAIVVLGGDSSGGRLERGVELFRRGIAPRLVLSGGQVYPGATWAGLMRQHALSLGVPAEAIIVQDASATTAEDAAFSARALRAAGASSAVVVTSSWHSRRAMRLFRRAEPRILWVSCPRAPEWRGPWWRDPDAARALASEALKWAWPEALPPG